MRYILICSFLLSHFSYAKSSRLYSFGDYYVAFHEKEGLVVNLKCDSSSCMAWEMGKKYKTSKMSSLQLKGGRNPSSVKCKELMKGSVLIGLDHEGNQQSFCYFSDGSYLK